MNTHPTSFKEWQSYSSIPEYIHIAWFRQAKKSKIDFEATKKIVLVNNQQ